MKKTAFLVVLLVVFNSMNTTTAQTQPEVKKLLVPTVTIPAPLGSKGFGMPQSNKAKHKCSKKTQGKCECDRSPENSHNDS